VVGSFECSNVVEYFIIMYLYELLLQEFGGGAKQFSRSFYNKILLCVKEYIL